MKAFAALTIAVVASAGFGASVTTTSPPAPVPPTASAQETPPAGDQGTVTVDSPRDGEKLISRLPRFFGTAPLTATIVVTVAGEERARDVVDPTGHFSVVVPFTLREEARQDVRITAIVGGAEVASTERSVVLPPSFVVATPAQNATTASRDVVISGTAVPDSSISLVVQSGLAGGTSTTAVSSEGEWSTTLSFATDAERAQSVTVRQIVAGDQRGEFVLRFMLPTAAPAQPIPEDESTVQPVAASPSLPETGSAPEGALLVLSLALMITGGVVVARRRATGRR